MKEYRASTMIKAPPERIWAILIDGAAYPEWEPNTVRIDGQIGPGEKLTAWSKLSPGRAFPVRVTEFVPGQKMTWSGGMPLGLFTGTRSFVLTPQDDGATEFTLREVFSGPLLGVFGRSLPDLNAAFACCSAVPRLPSARRTSLSVAVLPCAAVDPGPGRCGVVRSPQRPPVV